jgi:hypothetical protein
LVAKAARAQLDEPVPLELTRQICLACTTQFYLSPGEEVLRSYKPNDTTATEVLSALQVHELYGPAVIEEVLERGSAKVA